MSRWRARLLPVIPLVPVAALAWLAMRATPNAHTPEGLYSDDAIRQLARHDCEAACRAARSIFDVPCLDVVPPGETRPRREVFEALGLEDRRVGQPKARAEGRVAFVRWRVSATFDLVYMTGNDDYDTGAAAWGAPDRAVYGVRLVSRESSPGRDWW